MYIKLTLCWWWIFGQGWEGVWFSCMGHVEPEDMDWMLPWSGTSSWIVLIIWVTCLISIVPLWGRGCMSNIPWILPTCMLETCPPTSLLNSFIFQFPQHIYYTVNITGIIPLSICPSWLRMNRIKLLQHRLQQYRMMVIPERNYPETNRWLHLFSEISFHPPDSRLVKLQWRRTREKRRLVSYSCHRVVALNPNSVFTLM